LLQQTPLIGLTETK